jgi:hypothetical protein
MNLATRYQTKWFGSYESACPNTTACLFAILLELQRELKKVVYSKQGYYPEAKAWGQRPWTSCGCRPVTPLPPQHTKHWFIAGVCPLGKKCTHLRKSSFLVAAMVVNFIRKRCSNIRKIYQLIKMITGQKASGSNNNTPPTCPFLAVQTKKRHKNCSIFQPLIPLTSVGVPHKLLIR